MTDGTGFITYDESTMLLKKKFTWRDLRYWMLFTYLGWMHDAIYYRRVYFVHRERVPKPGVPLVVVANHQNALNDPLAIEFGFRSRIVSIFARGDIFANKFVGNFLKFLYILPAYRMRTEGLEGVERNRESFDEAHDRLLRGGTVAIFPEGTNQDKRWLGEFSQGYLRMAFGAAEKSGFTEDIKILPTAIHYSNYFHMQSDMMMVSGEPVSLMPYYELYKVKPRTAMREVNHRVRDEVAGLMLNITDLENYEAIDYLRGSYGVKFAKERGLRPGVLPEKLEADKELVAHLDALKAEKPEEAAEIYAETLRLKALTEKYGVRDWNYDCRCGKAMRVLWAAGLLLLLPLFAYALIPNVVAYFAPRRLVRKFDEMGGPFRLFAGGIQFALNALVVLPVMYGAVFVIDFFVFHWIYALVHFLALPWLGLFAWHYRLWCIKWRGARRFARASRTEEEMQEAIALRNRLWQRLDEVLNV